MTNLYPVSPNNTFTKNAGGVTRVYIGAGLKLEGLTLAGYSGAITTKHTPVMTNPVLLNADGKQVHIDAQISSRCYKAFVTEPELYTKLPNTLFGRDAIEGYALLFIGIARAEHAEAIAALKLDGEDVFATMCSSTAPVDSKTQWHSVSRKTWVTYAPETHIDWMMNEIRRAARVEIRLAQRANDEKRLKQAGEWLYRADVEGLDLDLVSVCMPDPKAFLRASFASSSLRGAALEERVQKMFESGRWKRARSAAQW